MTGDNGALMTSAKSCYKWSEKSIARSMAALAAAAWTENYGGAATTSAITNLAD